MDNTEKNLKEEAPSPNTPTLLDDRTPCEDCWMGEYKEIGYRYCGNTKCPLMPGAGN
ncbi:MAG: hypothetical protein ACM3Y9_04765 [Ignavibacteria bacterium]